MSMCLSGTRAIPPRAMGSSSTMRTRVFMRTPQWNGDDGLTASTVATSKFQRRLVPVELFQARLDVAESDAESQAQSRCRTRAIIADTEPNSAVVAFGSDL